MQLVSSPSEAVVAQAVVVIRQLLQKNAELHSGVIKSMVKLLDTVHVPMARTAIVWIIGEYREKIPKMAPDSLRKLAKSFKDEHDDVKMQTLNLAVKLFITNPQQTSLLFKYVMDLCKFDMNYDLRDRSRLYRSLFFKKKNKVESKEVLEVKESMKRVLLSSKPSPHIEQPFQERQKFTLSSLSHVISNAATGYENLPDFPIIAPDGSVRQPVSTESTSETPTHDKKKKKKVLDFMMKQVNQKGMIRIMNQRKTIKVNRIKVRNPVMRRKKAEVEVEVEVEVEAEVKKEKRRVKKRMMTMMMMVTKKKRKLLQKRNTHRPHLLHLLPHLSLPHLT